MPQGQRYTCSRCGSDIARDFPDCPVLTYIVSGVLGSDQMVDGDQLNPGIEAMLTLNTPRIELCPACASDVLTFDAAFVEAVIETADRQEKARSARSRDVEERLAARKERVQSRLASDIDLPMRMAAPPEALFVGEGGGLPSQPAPGWVVGEVDA